MRAAIAFCDNADKVRRHPLDRFLKPGFKHCFAVVLVEGYWILIDGAYGIPAISVVAGSDMDMAQWLRDDGYTVVEVEQGGKALASPMVHNNCVGLVKAVLCISAPLVVTPYQLWKFLK